MDRGRRRQSLVEWTARRSHQRMVRRMTSCCCWYCSSVWESEQLERVAVVRRSWSRREDRWENGRQKFALDRLLTASNAPMTEAGERGSYILKRRLRRKFSKARAPSRTFDLFTLARRRQNMREVSRNVLQNFLSCSTMERARSRLKISSDQSNFFIPPCVMTHKIHTANGK